MCLRDLFPHLTTLFHFGIFSYLLHGQFLQPSTLFCLIFGLHSFLVNYGLNMRLHTVHLHTVSRIWSLHCALHLNLLVCTTFTVQYSEAQDKKSICSGCWGKIWWEILEKSRICVCICLKLLDQLHLMYIRALAHTHTQALISLPSPF